MSAALGGPVDPDAAARLWKLTRGNALYLRNIVEQEIADGRIQLQNGYWQWIGEPIMPKGLVELIEARFGALSQPVGEVIDALAVGEPLEMTTLRRIADPDAIEEAHVRGLITVDEVDDGMEVRLAHPLYGEVRRSRSPETRLRRLRGLVAAELASAAGSDDMRNVVRRATLSLDSDLTPDADLMLKAAGGAVWLGDLRLADRLAKAAIRADGAPRAYFLRAHALSWLFAGQEADAVLAELSASELTDDDRGRLAYQRASNMLWAIGDAPRAKEIIDEAARSTSPATRIWIDAFLTAYWFALDQPQEAIQASKSLVLEELPAVAGAETAWALAVMYADAGQTAKAVAVANTGYAVASRFFDSPHMRFNIADAHVSALLLAGQMADGFEVAQRVYEQGAEMPGAAHLLGTAIAGRAALFAGRLDSACALVGNRQRPRCRRRGMPWAGDTGITSHTPPRWRCGARPTRRPRCSPRSTTSDGHFACWITSAAWPAHGWRLGRAPSPRRSPRCWQQPKPLRPKDNSRPRWYACRPPCSSGITRARLG